MACLWTERRGSEQAARPALCLADVTVSRGNLSSRYFSCSLPGADSKVLITQEDDYVEPRPPWPSFLASLAPGCSGSGHLSLPPHQLSQRKGKLPHTGSQGAVGSAVSPSLVRGGWGPRDTRGDAVPSSPAKHLLISHQLSLGPH